MHESANENTNHRMRLTMRSIDDLSIDVNEWVVILDDLSQWE